MLGRWGGGREGGEDDNGAGLAGLAAWSARVLVSYSILCCLWRVCGRGG